MKTKDIPPRPYGKELPGKFYLVGRMSSGSCCRLPFQFTPELLFKNGPAIDRMLLRVLLPEEGKAPDKCGEGLCSFFRNTRYPLIWIDEKMFPSAAHFVQEAKICGGLIPITERVAMLIASEFNGETFLLGHDSAIVRYIPGAMTSDNIYYAPGIFGTFIPVAVQYIPTGKESQHYLNSLLARAIYIEYPYIEEETGDPAEVVEQETVWQGLKRIIKFWKH